MPFIATLTFDYSAPHHNPARQRLMKSLEAVGWEYVPTSSMILDGAGTIDPVLEALEILARTLNQPGQLSMLALQVKSVGATRPTPGATTPLNALKAVRNLPSPPI